MRVDFPAPFSPKRTWTSPARRSKLTPSSARTPGNSLTMLSMESISGMPFLGGTVRRWTSPAREGLRKRGSGVPGAGKEEVHPLRGDRPDRAAAWRIHGGIGRSEEGRQVRKHPENIISIYAARPRLH